MQKSRLTNRDVAPSTTQIKYHYYKLTDQYQNIILLATLYKNKVSIRNPRHNLNIFTKFWRFITHYYVS